MTKTTATHPKHSTAPMDARGGPASGLVGLHECDARQTRQKGPSGNGGSRARSQAGARTLGLQDLAAELGRSPDWLYANWRQLVARDGLPPPIFSTGTLTWQAVHIWAWLDKSLPARLRRRVEALRLAEAALDADWVASKRAADEVADWRSHLDTLHEDTVHEPLAQSFHTCRDCSAAIPADQTLCQSCDDDWCIR